VKREETLKILSAPKMLGAGCFIMSAPKILSAPNMFLEIFDVFVSSCAVPY